MPQIEDKKIPWDVEIYLGKIPIDKDNVAIHVLQIMNRVGNLCVGRFSV